MERRKGAWSVAGVLCFAAFFVVFWLPLCKTESIYFVGLYNDSQYLFYIEQQSASVIPLVPIPLPAETSYCTSISPGPAGSLCGTVNSKVASDKGLEIFCVKDVSTSSKRQVQVGRNQSAWHPPSYRDTVWSDNFG